MNEEKSKQLLSNSLTKFIDPLPIPRTLQPISRKKQCSYYEVTMSEFTQQLHSELPFPTTVWGYEGTYPGPTFEVNRGECVHVKWKNNLPLDHLLPVDQTVHGAAPTNLEVRTVVHLHGGSTPPESDGYPEAWFSKDFENVGPLFEQKTYQYPNDQRATALWYHDHALGITRLNVYAGLAGFYLIRDNEEKSLKLPEGPYEIPLVIQDRSFNEDGSLFYPSCPNELENGSCEGDGLPDPSIIPEFFGNTILVNGKVWPFLNVEPRKYRFRLLNGSNSRFYILKFDNKNLQFIQIGTDGGLLETPVTLKEIILGPAERADVIVDFTKFDGKEIVLRNLGPDGPFTGVSEDPADPNTTGQVMKFKVVKHLEGTDKSKVPTKLSKIKRLSPEDACKQRELSLIEAEDEFGRLKLLLDNKEWMNLISETPILGTTEVWNLVNTTPDTHPIHVHLVQFQILERRPFNVQKFLDTGEVIYTGEAVQPDLNERGWKDTVRANPGEVTSIIAQFSPYPGKYVWHCHILEHEDHEMMRPYEVIKSKCKHHKFDDCPNCKQDPYEGPRKKYCKCKHHKIEDKFL
ncbi:multicopper oxidase [Bacillus sp. FJAT-52991]|uniref:Multicopper oxidase n=1 Tax=Bacillus kandeliae TaxID=3129297 RepID=A0ABZ2N1Z6_9BACI